MKAPAGDSQDELREDLFPVVYSLDGLSCPGVQLAFKHFLTVCADLAQEARRRLAERQGGDNIEAPEAEQRKRAHRC